MNKDELRKIFLAKRLALTDDEYRKLSIQISDLFFRSVDFSQIQTLHIYLPIVSKREPDTWPIIDRIRNEFPFIRLVVPRVNGEKMENILFENTDQLERTKWGMVEPSQGIQIPSKEIDAVIVPLLLFDSSGNRLGYGKGFYDRFLYDCRSDCRKIGLSFFEPEIKIEHIDQFDVPLTQSVTPLKFYQF